MKLKFFKAKDELKHLKEVRNYGLFEFLHGHVIENGNVCICHCLLESIPSKAFTSKEGHWATVRRTQRRRLGLVSIKTHEKGVSSGLGHRYKKVKNHNRSDGRC